MPNWCDTTYYAVGDERELKTLYELMTEISEMENPRVENGFGSYWLGCLVDALGEDWHKVGCRGTFYDVDLNDGELSFVTDTAWAPCDDVIDLLRRKFPSLDFYYYAEEQGCGVYITNDNTGEYFPDRYLVSLNTEDNDYCEEYFETLEDAYAWISDGLEKPITNAEELKAYDEWLTEQSDDYYCYIHEIQVVDR